MKTLFLAISLLLGTFLLTSCGPTEAEKTENLVKEQNQLVREIDSYTARSYLTDDELDYILVKLDRLERVEKQIQQRTGRTPKNLDRIASLRRQIFTIKDTRRSTRPGPGPTRKAS